MNFKKQELINAYEKSICNYVEKSCVFLIPGKVGEIAEYVGSGLLLSTSNQNLVILTAGHVVKDARKEEFRLGFYKCKDSIGNFIKGIIFHPDNSVDLSLVIPDVTKVKSILSHYVDSEKIFYFNERSITGSYKILTGFPSSLVADTGSDNNKIQGFICMTYLCEFGRLKYDEHRKICINWDDLVVHNTDISLGRNFKPSGMSGGPLWIFPPIEPPEVWSPDKHSYVIGIQSKWNKKKLLKVEPLSPHFKWLKEKLKVIDDFLVENA